MYGAGATKGKGKGGKGKERAPRKEGGQGHLLEKTRLSVDKFAGIVVAWKGKYGWIKPGEEIEHEKASLRNGDLFVGISDLDDGATSLEEGAPVEFHIFEDSSGLGAEEVVATGPGDPSLAKGSKGKGSAKGGSKGAGWGVQGDASWKGAAWGPAGYGGKGAAKGAKAGWSLASGQAVYGGAKGVQSGYGGYGGKSAGYGGKSADKGKGKGKDKGKATASGAPRGQGHTLPKTRISVEKFTGTVKSWKGKYGWIEPAEEIEHEKAAKNKGAIWVSMNDIEGADSLEEGATVEFHLTEDSSGLGAEEVVAM